MMNFIPKVPPGSSEEFSRRTAVLFFLILLGILFWSFSQNQDCLLIGLDGTQWRITLPYHAANRVPFSQTGVDPFQGSFDAYFPVNLEYLLPSALTLLFNDATPDRAMTYFVYGTFLLVAAYTLARTIGFGRPVALLAGFLLAVFALPAFANRGSELYPLFALNPHMSQIVSLSILIVAAFWALERKKSISILLLLVFVPGVCFVFALLGLAQALVLMVPAVALYGGASIFEARHWRDDIPRIVAGTLLIVIPAALGMAHYFYSLVGYTAYDFFAAEFEQVRPGNLSYVSTLFWNSTWNLSLGLGRLVIPLGIVGAGWTAFTQTGRLRLFALTHLFATTLFLGIGFVTIEFVRSYQGIAPVYFETCFWPYALLFAASAVVTAVQLVLHALRRLMIASLTRVTAIRPLPSAARMIDGFSRWSERRVEAIVLIGTVVFVAGFNVKHTTRQEAQCLSVNFSPIRSISITEIVESTIGLQAGKTFNGFAATIYGLRAKPSISWSDFHGYDYMMWKELGNDLRTVGLWSYKIPTLFQYSAFMTPTYYLLLTEFLARREDRQSRSVLVLTQMNETMLRLWGVRYVITDTQPSFGATRAQTPISNGDTIRLVELSDINIGDYSPTEVRRVRDFREGLAVMHDPKFDGRHVVVADAVPDGTFVKAEHSQLVYEKDGLTLRATSPGHSLLVLPIQYSNCWTVSGATQATLFRADLMQLGISFTGKLDARLTFRYGPLFAGSCRIADMNDVERLRIREARQSRRAPATNP